MLARSVLLLSEACCAPSDVSCALHMLQTCNSATIPADRSAAQPELKAGGVRGLPRAHRCKHAMLLPWTGERRAVAVAVSEQVGIVSRGWQCQSAGCRGALPETISTLSH